MQNENVIQTQNKKNLMPSTYSMLTENNRKTRQFVNQN